MKDKLNITLHIAGEQLSMTVSRSQEQIIREAASQVNDVWRKMHASFKDGSASHTWARVALIFAHGFLSARETGERADKMLQQLEAKLDDLLRNDE